MPGYDHLRPFLSHLPQVFNVQSNVLALRAATGSIQTFLDHPLLE